MAIAVDTGVCRSRSAARPPVMSRRWMSLTTGQALTVNTDRPKRPPSTPGATASPHPVRQRRVT